MGRRMAVKGGCSIPASHILYRCCFGVKSAFGCGFGAEPFVPLLLPVEDEECLRGEWGSLGLRWIRVLKTWSP